MICTAGHQPNLYPYGGFFAKAASVDKFVVVDVTQYVKKQYHNRNRIKLLDGSTHWLSIPVRNAGHYRQPINSMEIDNSRDWRRVHGKTILLNYKKTPFFELYYPRMEELLSREWTMLSEYNTEAIRLFMELLGISVPLLVASAEEISGRSSELILDICRKAGADAYLHGIHSMDYADFGMLKANGIRSFVQEFKCPEYPQNSPGFIPNLSVIDMLFNCGPRTKELLLQGNSIKEISSEG